MSLEGLLIGLLYICLYAVILCIVVYALLFFAARFGLAIPPQIVNLIWAAVGLVIIIMIVSAAVRLAAGYALSSARRTSHKWRRCRLIRRARPTSAVVASACAILRCGQSWPVWLL